MRDTVCCCSYNYNLQFRSKIVLNDSIAKGSKNLIHWVKTQFTFWYTDQATFKKKLWCRFESQSSNVEQKLLSKEVLSKEAFDSIIPTKWRNLGRAVRGGPFDAIYHTWAYNFSIVFFVAFLRHPLPPVGVRPTRPVSFFKISKLHIWKTTAHSTASRFDT